MIKAASPQSQFFSTKSTNRLNGNANIRAVKNESCLGEVFLGESILRRYKAQGTRYKSQGTRNKRQNKGIKSIPLCSL